MAWAGGYCSATQVRTVRTAAFNALSTTITDDFIGAKHDLFAKPVIDARLADKGAPWAVGSAPSIVALIAALLTAAAVFDDSAYAKGKPSEIATEMKKDANDLLDRIVTGEMWESGITTGTGFLVSEADDDRPSTEVFTSPDELNWQDRDEVRES